MSLDLLPAEKIALTVALAQIQRGEYPQPNTASMCVLALARLDGRHDWRQDKALHVEAAESEPGYFEEDGQAPISY